MRNIGLRVNTQREGGIHEHRTRRRDVPVEMTCLAVKGDYAGIADMIRLDDMQPQYSPARYDMRLGRINYGGGGLGSFADEAEYFAMWDKIDNRLFENGELKFDKRMKIICEKNNYEITKRKAIKKAQEEELTQIYANINPRKPNEPMPVYENRLQQWHDENKEYIEAISQAIEERTQRKNIIEARADERRRFNAQRRKEVIEENRQKRAEQERQMEIFQTHLAEVYEQAQIEDKETRRIAEEEARKLFEKFGL